jgi:hypothetical protein
MPGKLLKVIGGFTAVITAIPLFIEFLRTVANKKAIADFFSDTFKYGWLFKVFLASLVLFAISLIFDYRKKEKQVGFRFAHSDQKLITRVNKYNQNIKYARIITGSLATILFILLIIFEFRMGRLGIVGGSFGKNEIFTEKLEFKIRDGRPSKFEFSYDNSIPYKADSNRQERLFKRFYKQGVIYTGQYDNSTTDSIISLEVRWIGDPLSCPIDTHFFGEFSKCTVDVTSDANMVSNFILGFTYMHLCDKSDKALEYFSMVRKSIDSLKYINFYVTLRLGELREIIDKYTARIQSNQNRIKSNEDSPLLVDTTSSPSKSDSTKSKGIIQKDTKHFSDGKTLDDSVANDIIVDSFSNTSIEYMKKIVRGVNTKGGLYLGLSTLTEVFEPYYIFPIYICEDKNTKQINSVTKRHPSDTYFDFQEMDNGKFSRGPLPLPYFASDIELYLKKYNQGALYKFSRPPKIYSYNSTMADPFKGKYSGIRVALNTNIPTDSIKYFVKEIFFPSAENNIESHIKWVWPNFNGFGFPFHVLVSPDSVLLIYEMHKNSNIYYKINSKTDYYDPKGILIMDIEGFIRKRYGNYSHYIIHKAPEVKFED